MQYKIRKGEYIGHAPYGYRKSTEQKNKLRIEENEAEVIKEIYSMYLEGYGYGYIAKKLTGKGYPAPGFKIAGLSCRGWNPAAVQRILSSRVYVGDTVQGVSEKISFKSKKTRRLPREKWVMTPNTHEAIIGREQFEEVQRIREQKAEGSGTHKGTLHIFRGLLYCGDCGSTMFARLRKDRPMGYICSKYGKSGSTACSSHFIGEKELNDCLVHDLLEVMKDKEVDTRVENLLEKEFVHENETKDELNKLEQQIKTKKRQQDTLYMDRLEGKISEELFFRTNKNLESKIQQMEERVKKIRRKKAEDYTASTWMEQMKQWLGRNSLTHDMAALLVERIIVYDGKIDGKMSENEADLVGKGTIVIEYKFS